MAGDVPAVEISTLVSYLQMQRPGQVGDPVSFPIVLRDKHQQTFRLEQWSTPNVDDYRALYRAVGEVYLWWERLAMDDAALERAIDPATTTIVRLIGADKTLAGYAEWSIDGAKREARIAYFGLIAGHEGSGLARPMMQAVQQTIWHDAQCPTAILVNTCTLDHPRALGFYRHLGFEVTYRQQMTFPDPRVERA